MVKMNLGAFEKALKGTGGIYSAIAEKMGVARQTVSTYVKRSAKARMLWEQEVETVKDMAEGGLFSNIKSKDMGAIKYFLSTRGKDRGYVEKTEVEHSGGVNSYQIIIEEKKSEENDSK